ncbi:MAG: hypothetical protein WCP63_11755 [Cyanobium sp. ELA712]
MASFRTALLATAATALSLAATPAALANGLTFTNYTTTSTCGGLGSNRVYGVYASGSSIYAATDSGLSIAQQSDPTPSAVPGPLPLFGAASAFGFSRKLRRRLRAAATGSPCC